MLRKDKHIKWYPKIRLKTECASFIGNCFLVLIRRSAKEWFQIFDCFILMRYLAQIKENPSMLLFIFDICWPYDALSCGRCKEVGRSILAVRSRHLTEGLSKLYPGKSTKISSM